MNYNTDLHLWVNQLAYMDKNEAGPLLIDDGMVMESRDSREVIGRFNSTADAIKTLKLAGFSDSDFVCG